MATDESDTLELIVRDGLLILIFPVKGVKVCPHRTSTIDAGLETHYPPERVGVEKFCSAANCTGI